VNASELALGTRRFVWCTAGGRVLHGRTRPGPAPRPTFWQRLLGREPSGGTLYVFDPIDEATARRALAAHLAAPGAFALETAEGARLDFQCAREAGTLTLDCWFFECADPLDCLVISRASAEAVLAAVYALATDREVAARLRELELPPAGALQRSA
jgi:hypothetical protein